MMVCGHHGSGLAEEILYGPYTEVPPLAVSAMRLHFENNAPFVRATSLVRDLEVRRFRV